MTHSLFQIEIPKRNSSCFKGGERLVPGMEYYSLLSHDESQHTIRCDFCLSCWQQFSVEADLTKSHVYWRSHIEVKKESVAKQEKSKMARALTLLKSFLQEVNKNEAEIFVLALFLAYARRLILRQEIEREDSLYSLYEVAHQDEFLLIKKIELSQLEIADIQHSLSEKLNS
jgi:hypothetical protein